MSAREHAASNLSVPNSRLSLMIPRHERNPISGCGFICIIFSTSAAVASPVRIDWGMYPLDAEAARDIFEILECRTSRGSVIIVSQVPVDNWYDIIPVPTIADAILDRLVHNAYRIEMKGESMRKKLSPLTSDNN